MAERFTVDGILEAPFVPAGHSSPQRMEGREEIRRELADHYRRDANNQAGLADMKVNEEESRVVVYTTADPDVFVAETDTAFDKPEGIDIVSVVKIFHMRAGEIVLLRDYFAPDLLD